MSGIGLQSGMLRGGSYDADAAIYFAAIATAGSSISTANKTAVNAFVAGCKADGIWTAIKASCLLCAADDLTGALVPLVGAAPTNNNFVSGDYSRTLGLTGNGTTKYLASNRANNADQQNSKHLAVWLSSTSAGNKCLLGSGGASPGDSQILQTTSVFFRANRTSVAAAFAGVLATGFAGTTRALSTENTYRNPNGTGTFTDTSTSPSTDSIDVFRRSAGTLYSNQRLSFYSIGESLNLSFLDARLATLMAALT